jgi:hypothetical protein
MKTKLLRFTTFLFITFLMVSCASDEVLSPDNKIISFTVTKGQLSKQFDITETSISGKVDTDFELKDISLTVVIAEGATISPDPATIKSITGPFSLTVTAANGDQKVYKIEINREPGTGNSLLEFNINASNFLTNATIDEKTGIITKRLPEFVDLENLSVDLKISKYASIAPDPKTIKDYSSPVSFTVKSESGVEKVYQVKLEYMNVSRFRSCTETNAWKWFGGDNRTNGPDILPYDRNVATGQVIIVDKDLVPSSFSIHLREGFFYDEDNQEYNKPVELKLIIKDANLKTLASTTTSVSGEFNGGFIPFDLQKLNLVLEANKKYVFYWYLVDGEKLGIMASSSADKNSGSGFCFNSSYAGESRISENTNIEDLKVIFEHIWHFNIELEGKE